MHRSAVHSMSAAAALLTQSAQMHSGEERGVEIVANKEHLTNIGLTKIISLKSAINKGLPKNLTLKFKEVELTVRPKYIANENSLNPN